MYCTLIVSNHNLFLSIRLIFLSPFLIGLKYWSQISVMEKSTTTHQDAIEQISNDSHSDSNMSGDLAIIHELETHGEVIGVTWRTILAASVSN